ncbi:MAG: hypothetical protein E6L04_01040 [Thaumarchaeota archaeon]|nr:MAG: hypothetical protein E6L04_01040 [Nitrososphaerota archaeon]
MSKQDEENKLSTRKNQNSLSEAKDNPETDIYENPIEKPAQMVDDEMLMKTQPNFSSTCSCNSRLLQTILKKKAAS